MADVKKTAEEQVQYDPQYILQVKDLKKYFPIKGGMLNKTVGYVKAVDGVTFNLKRGTTMGLVGESGCGKTTTGRTILRLSGEKTDGQVLFNGQEVYDLNAKEMRDMRTKMQIIFQDPFSSLQPLQGGVRRLHRQGHGRLRPAVLPQGPLSPRVLRRPAPAYLHRPRSGSEARVHRLR